MAKKKRPQKAEQRKSDVPQAANNPFEQFHTKRRFDVLGKAPKGAANRPVKLTKARAAAVDKRKKSLLVEYKALKKSNAFIDRRFGENDAGLSPDEKALLRYQKQRSNQLSKQQRFQLNDDSDGGFNAVLTHMGRSLAEEDDDLFVKAAPRNDDVFDDDLADELVKEFHFGGGQVAHDEGADGGSGQEDEAAPSNGGRRSKKEVMSELIAKSKAHKAAKQLQHEKDDAEVRQLDEALNSLLQERKLAALFRPKGVKESQKADNAVDAAFDKATKELVFEMKAAPTERLLTEEELAAKEAEAMQKLEQERRRRMIAGSDEEDDDEAAGGAGGYAGRRKRRLQQEEQADKRQRREATGDADEDDFELDSDSDDDGRRGKSQHEDSEASGRQSDDDSAGTSEDHTNDDVADAGIADALAQRRKQRAAGEHPLRSSFRAASAALLLKHGLKPTKLAIRDLKDQQEQKDGSADEDDDEQEADGQDVDGLSASDDEQPGSESELSTGPESIDGDDEDEGGGEASDRSTRAGAAGAQIRTPNDGTRATKFNTASLKRARVEADETENDDELEGDDGIHVIRADTDQERGHDALPVVAVVRGSLPQQQQQQRAGARGNRVVMLTGPLELPYTLPMAEDFDEYWQLVDGRSGEDVGHIISRIRSSNAAQLLADRRRGTQELYGFLMQHFALEAGQTPPNMAVLDALTKHLSQLTMQVPRYAVKSAQARLEAMGKRLQSCLKDPAQLPNAWPHPRVLFLCRLWALLFPVSDRRHPVLTPTLYMMGAYLSLCPVTDGRTLAMGLYLAALMCHMAHPGQKFVPEPLNFAVQAFDKLSRIPKGHEKDRRTDGASEGAKCPQLSLTDILTRAADDSVFATSAFREAASAAAVHLVTSCAQCYGDVAASPELFGSAVIEMEKLAGCKDVSQALRKLASDTAASVRSSCLNKVRSPLVRAPTLRQADIKLYNPRFEDSFVASKDYDPDRERAEQRRLKRQVRKETRGAMRELRKDATFLYEEREREKALVDAERSAAFKRAMRFMYQQHSDLKSGGQGGMWNKNKDKKKQKLGV